MHDPKTHFQAWVGEQYGASTVMGGKRVLVLGESHYEWLDNQKLEVTWTRQFIEASIKGSKQVFSTRVAATLAGRLLTTEKERHDFWHSIAFANYIPVSVGRGPKANPTEEMWEAAIPAFAKLINTHTPDFLLVLGHELWMRMHYTFEMDGRVERHQNNLNEWRTWRYRYPNGKPLLACATKHPSRNFNFRNWHPFVREMLEKA